MLAELPVKIPAKTVSPIDHRGDREHGSAGFQRLGVEVRSGHVGAHSAKRGKTPVSPAQGSNAGLTAHAGKAALAASAKRKHRVMIERRFPRLAVCG
jgi:hypothetical protein